MRRILDDTPSRTVGAPRPTAVAEAYPGDRADRQPVHTVYGGAHLFSADITAKLGAAALRALNEYAPDPAAFARAIGLTAPESLARALYDRVVEKLKREPVEDYRIDFEDGYGNRTDPEEDAHAVADAEELARGMKTGSLPPFTGIRIKPLTEELRGRAPAPWAVPGRCRRRRRLPATSP
jgi:hypothetical protein